MSAQKRKEHLDDIKGWLEELGKIFKGTPSVRVFEHAATIIKLIAGSVLSIELLDGREFADKVANRVRANLSPLGVRDFDAQLSYERERWLPKMRRSK